MERGHVCVRVPTSLVVVQSHGTDVLSIGNCTKVCSLKCEEINDQNQLSGGNWTRRRDETCQTNEEEARSPRGAMTMNVRDKLTVETFSYRSSSVLAGFGESYRFS